MWPIWLVGRVSSSLNAAMLSCEWGLLNHSGWLLPFSCATELLSNPRCVWNEYVWIRMETKPAKVCFQMLSGFCFFFFFSSFAPEGKFLGEWGLDNQLRKLRKCTHACVYFQNSHPCLGCCFSGETRDVFPPLLHTALTDWCSVSRKKRNACPKTISHIFEQGTRHIIFFPWFLALKALPLLFIRWLCLYSLIDDCVWWRFLNRQNDQVSEIYRQLLFV